MLWQLIGWVERWLCASGSAQIEKWVESSGPALLSTSFPAQAFVWWFSVHSRNLLCSHVYKARALLAHSLLYYQMSNVTCSYIFHCISLCQGCAEALGVPRYQCGDWRSIFLLSGLLCYGCQELHLGWLCHGAERKRLFWPFGLRLVIMLKEDRTKKKNMCGFTSR